MGFGIVHMHCHPQEKHLRYADMPKYQALQLPYNDRQTLATIILPKDFWGCQIWLEISCKGWRFGGIEMSFHGQLRDSFFKESVRNDGRVASSRIFF